MESFWAYDTTLFQTIWRLLIGSLPKKYNTLKYFLTSYQLPATTCVEGGEDRCSLLPLGLSALLVVEVCSSTLPSGGALSNKSVPSILCSGGSSSGVKAPCSPEQDPSDFRSGLPNCWCCAQFAVDRGEGLWSAFWWHSWLVLALKLSISACRPDRTGSVRKFSCLSHAVACAGWPDSLHQICM